MVIQCRMILFPCNVGLINNALRQFPKKPVMD